ncbi:MAG: molybdopterin-dependent oxidoreductase, partial [Acidobacteria bacterium]|nr:molybdopterin-dependent oxidoreductase [Acidobacteriota bacterium]
MADLAGSNGTRMEFKAVGAANVPGRLSYSIATGMAKFGIDAVVPDMLHAKFLRNPHGRAKIRSMDISKAKALAGVVDIVRWDDPEILSLKGTREPMIDDESDTENEEIGAIVVAETPEICDEALRLIEVDWEVFPTITDPRDALKPDGVFVRFDPKKSQPPRPYVVGDVEKAFAAADHIMEFDWANSIQVSHIPNPNTSVAWWAQDPQGPRGESLHIHGIYPTWGAFNLRPMYNLIFDNIHRHTLFQGGKYCDWMLRRSQLITPLLSRRTGRPVRCANVRQNDFYPAHPQHYRHVKFSFTNDGIINGAEEDVIADSGAPVPKTARDTGGGASSWSYSPFNTTKCTNLRSTTRRIYTSSGRNTGSNTSPFDWDAKTIAFQLIAEKLDMDIIDVALRNVHGPSSQSDPGIPPSLVQCIEKGKKLMNWQWHRAGTKKLPDGRMHGLSFRYAMSPRHAQAPYTATVTIQGDNKVYVPLKGPWIGIYAAECSALVVAEELGAKIEDVILLYDNKAIFTPVGGGSDGTSASAWVMKEAAVACKKTLLELAAASSSFKCRPEDLDTRDTMVYLKSDPSRAIPFGTFIANEGFNDHDKDITATYFGKPPETTWHRAGHILDVMNVQFCEVAVDTETGEVEVLKYVAVADPGKVLRLTSFEGQLHHAMLLSHGGLMEQMIYDPVTGVKLNTNMIEYKKPGIMDLGPIETDTVETRSHNAAYGSSGISHAMAAPSWPLCAVA